MIGSVIKQEDTQWIPPVDAVLEMHSGTSPAAIYPDTVWTQLKNCIIIAAGDTFKAGETGGQARISLTAGNLAAHTHTATIGSAGGGRSFNIMNPYYAVNIWQRVG